MKRLTCAIFFSLSLLSAAAQDVLYSDYKTEDNRDINFEILGKQGNSYLIYKNVRWKHILAFYNDRMRMERSFRLTFMPDETLNVDFITYPDHFYIIYQYHKRGVIYCKAAKLDNEGKLLTGPIQLDSTSIGLRQERMIYTTASSENKKNILISKMYSRGDRFVVLAKLYDEQLKLRDSTRTDFTYDDRYDIFSDAVVDDEGTFVIGKSKSREKKSSLSALDIIAKPLGGAVQQINIPLQDRYIEEFKIKADNRNRKFILNSFFITRNTGNIDGLFMASLNRNDSGRFILKSTYHNLEDSLRLKLNTGEKYQSAFNNLYIKNLVLAKDGGFVIAAESYYSQNSTYYPWRRYDPYGGMAPSYYDYNFINPSFGSYYRPFSTQNYRTSSKYYYDDILMMSFGNNFNPLWKTIIQKKQFDEGDDNFLSFGMINTGGEIHILFIEKLRNSQVVSNRGVQPGGDVKRYSTLKGGELGYEFMPKLAKQVSARHVIIPCIYRGYVCFAKVDLSILE